MAADGAIRVCMNIARYPPAFGGTGTRWQRQLPELAARGVEPTILTRRLGDERLPPAPEDAFPVHRELRAGEGVATTFARALEMRRYFAAHARSYDLLHTVIGGWELLLELGHLRRLGLPVVAEMVLLGSDDPESVSHQRFGRLKLRILRGIDAWIGLTREFLPAVLAAGIPEERFHLVPCGVDLERFRPRDPNAKRALRERLDLPPDARVVLSVGMICPRKAQERLLAAWRRLEPTPGRDLLVLLGPRDREEGLAPDDAAYSARLQRLAAEPGLAGTVLFTGRRSDVDAFMGAADLFALVSHQEGRATSMSEALASGLPCVLSPLRGTSAEFVSEGRTGFVVEDPDDAGALAAPLGRLLGDGALQARMSEAARTEAESRFPIGVYAEAVSGIYREVLARRAAASG
jgi:D-inositol-3-phosphate glycosyltransferase